MNLPPIRCAKAIFFIIIIAVGITQFTLSFFLKNEQKIISNVEKYTSNQSCTEGNKIATRALERVKGEECRKMIEEGACKVKSFLQHDFPESTCPNHNTSIINQYVGCFVNSSSNKVLNDYHFKNIKADRCQRECYRTGHLYYAIQNLDCSCGNSLNLTSSYNFTRCEGANCSDLKAHCSKKNGTDVYSTGLSRTVIYPKTSYVDPLTVKETLQPIKILYLLQFNGRNDRQVKRLLKAIYSPDHLYLIHVDKRQEYMKEEMRKTANLLPNVHLISDSFSTIWGGSSLLTMYLEAIKLSLELPGFSKWDYLINLSESDFPILPLHELEAQLKVNNGKTYLASHGYNTAKFVDKQGLDHYFVECEERMWRVGKRDPFPSNLRLDGGSDWLILHKDFAKYSISNETLPTKLRELFSTMLLPLESYYHTLAQNSYFCGSIISGNLKFTNWFRKQGCRCESLKKIVDWCGCSPLVIKSENYNKFQAEIARMKAQYFARKFDSLIDIDAIALAENQSYSDSGVLNSTHPSFNSTFINYYKADIDGENKLYKIIASNLLRKTFPEHGLINLDRIDIFKANSSAENNLIFTLQTNLGDVEILVKQNQWAQIYRGTYIKDFQLIDAKFGVNIDHKEEIFRNPVGAIDSNGTATIFLKWKRRENANASANEPSSPNVKFHWYNGHGQLIGKQNVKAYDSAFGAQFASLDLSTIKDNNQKESGVWKTIIESEEMVLGEVHFPVFDLSSGAIDYNRFSKYVDLFYSVLDSCTNNCTETIWSLTYPDPKSDINVGFDPFLNYIV